MLYSVKKTVTSEIDINNIIYEHGIVLKHHIEDLLGRKIQHVKIVVALGGPDKQFLGHTIM